MKGTGCQLCAAMIAGVAWSPAHHEHVGFQGANLWDERVQLLQTLYLGVEIPVLASGVGGLVVDEEEVVIVVVLPQSIDFVAKGAAPSEITLIPDTVAKPRYMG